MRIISSLAANSVKVMAATRLGSTPRAKSIATRPAMIEVLPEPAPASTSRERSSSVSAAMRADWSGSLSGVSHHFASQMFAASPSLSLAKAILRGR